MGFAMTLTVKELEALRPADKGRILSDGGSVWGSVHVAKDGAVSVRFSLTYRFGGIKRNARLGTWPDVGITDIRAARDTFKAKLKTEGDPVLIEQAAREAARKQAEIERLKAETDHQQALKAEQDRAEQDRIKAEADHQQALLEQRQRLEVIAAQQARLTVRDLFDRWQRLELAQRDDAGAEVARSFKADVFPLIGDMAAEDVSKAHIREILDGILSRATPAKPMIRTQKKTLSDLRQMFAFAIDRDMLEADPTARLKKKDIGKDGERDRVLTESELIEFFQKLPTSGLAETSQVALLIQLSTVARIGEILKAKWAHVDLVRSEWTLPDTKNGKAHIIRLNDVAVRQFERLHKATGLTAFCFPNTRMTDHVCEKTVTKQVADRQRTSGQAMTGRTQQTTALLIGEQWRPHDLRRTGATIMAELGALPDVIERCLNHTEENKMKRIYQRAQYEAPMREAWRMLGERLALLQSVAEGKTTNVVSLRKVA